MGYGADWLGLNINFDLDNVKSMFLANFDNSSLESTTLLMRTMWFLAGDHFKNKKKIETLSFYRILLSTESPNY